MYGDLYISSNTESLRYACDIVSNYIDDSLKRQLLTKLGLPVEPERSKRKNDGLNDEDARKKIKGENVDGSGVKPLEDYGSDKSYSIVSKVGPYAHQHL